MSGYTPSLAIPHVWLYLCIEHAYWGQGDDIPSPLLSSAATSLTVMLLYLCIEHDNWGRDDDIPSSLLSSATTSLTVMLLYLCIEHDNWGQGDDIPSSLFSSAATSLTVMLLRIGRTSRVCFNDFGLCRMGFICKQHASPTETRVWRQRLRCDKPPHKHCWVVIQWFPSISSVETVLKSTTTANYLAQPSPKQRWPLFTIVCLHCSVLQLYYPTSFESIRLATRF